MKDKNQYRQLVMLSIAVAVIIAQTAIFSNFWFFYYDHPPVIEPFSVYGNCVLIGMYAALCFLFYKLFGCFHTGYLRVYDMIFTQVPAMLCVNIFMYLQLCLTCRWRFGQHIGPMFLLTMLDLALVLTWGLFGRWIYLKLSPPRDLLVIYGEYSPDGLMKKLSSQPEKYRIKEVISIDADMDLIKKKMGACGAVVMTDIPSQTRNHLLKYAFANNIRCYSVPKISDIMIMNASNVNLFDTSLLLFRNNGLSLGQRFAKRALDILVSLVGLILISPIFLIIALCIKLYDGGPVLFTQERLTQNGKVFKILKFRSMRVQKEQTEYCMTRKNDSRITPVGKMLRNIHFDELPQLINILKGDMSIVGPRPECPGLARQYAQMIPEFDFRLKVKAGLTGYAQVYGKYSTTPYDKLKLDLTYIQKYSFWLDLKLIFMTFKILFQKENSEGIEDWQTSAATKDNLEKLKK